METNRYLGVVLPMFRYTSELDDRSQMCGYEHNYFNEKGKAMKTRQRVELREQARW